MSQEVTRNFIEMEETYGAHNYHPLDLVIERAEGIWVHDVEGRRFLDCLSAYSALNQGHNHPRIRRRAMEQMEKVTLTSRAFRNDQLPHLCRELCELTGKSMILPMNTGAEAVETAVKMARKWGEKVKGIPKDKAEIIVCSNNFHGRTVTIVSFSTEAQYRDGFGPLTPGFPVVPYGDLAALEAAITPNTCAFLVEPIQGEGGILIPPAGYMKSALELCQKENVLFMADEIQTGLGRTGRWFACDHEDVKADVYILGKALGGGFYPVSAVAADKSVLSVFHAGDHGSTFGGNPLGAAIARESLAVLRDEKLIENSAEMGEYFIQGLKKIQSSLVKEVRGRGLLIGLELTEKARPYCEELMTKGLLCKETHDNVIRFAPPLTIRKDEVDWALERIESTLKKA